MIQIKEATWAKYERLSFRAGRANEVRSYEGERDAELEPLVNRQEKL